MNHGRFLACLLAMLGLATCMDAVATEVDAVLRNDAQLADVCFVDPEHGWAVGDRGAIWHTEDGGAHWQLQRSNVECRLAAVWFHDRKTGWAAGGWTEPYTHVSKGVVLVTRDGGVTWSPQRSTPLPSVRALKFFDKSRGIAVGQQSALFPAGIFTTEDGGRSWSSLPPTQPQAWLTGDFIDPLTGIVAGRSSAVASVRRKGVEISRSADFGLRSVHCVRLTRTGNAWLAGDGGLVMRSDDGGDSWQAPPTQPPAPLRNHLDFHALAVYEKQLWLAGSPGTVVLHSPDGGQSWTAHSTGNRVPIRAMTFVDAQHGWAVGDLGTILTTRDGGRTWRTVRAGGSRAAVLGIFSEPRDVPLEFFAKLSGDDGYLSVVDILNRTDIEASTLHNAEVPARIHEALLHTGACAANVAWRFPSRQPGLALTLPKLLESWNHANDGRALARIDEHLVKTIRLWRPNVLVTTLTTADKNDARPQIVHQLVLRAMEHAADPQEYPEHLSEMGLAPWKVTKLYGALAAGQNGAANITSAHITRTGQSVADLASPARGLVERRYAPSPASLGFRLLVDHVPQEVGQRDFFSGIPLSPGGEARRMLRESAEQAIDAMRRSTQARRNLNAILARVDDRGLHRGRYLAEVTELVRTMDHGHAAEVLLQLARDYHSSGQWELAAETYDSIVTGYPKHPAAGAALVWLVQYYASGEASWRVAQKQQFNTVSRLEMSSGSDAVVAEATPVLQAPPRDVRQATAVLGLPGNDVDRPSRASGYAKQLEAHSAALFAEPQVRFPLAAAHRAQGYPRQAERFYLGFVRGRSNDAWWDCAQAEVAAMHFEGNDDQARQQSAKPLVRCVRAPARPRLDGKLTDPVWNVARSVDLRSPLNDDADWPAIAMLAHDDQFLYIAVHCRQTPETKLEGPAGPRPRDGDLSEHDHVEIYLDIDRDFVTAYRLAIDCRGWTHDSCWSDASWNPQWFVASTRTRDAAGDPSWTAEAAIPLSEIVGPSGPKAAWAIGIQRIIPNVGFQSWNKPAAAEVQCEGFGLMTLE